MGNDLVRKTIIADLIRKLVLQFGPEAVWYEPFKCTVVNEPYVRTEIEFKERGVDLRGIVEVQADDGDIHHSFEASYGESYIRYENPRFNDLVLDAVTDNVEPLR